MGRGQTAASRRAGARRRAVARAQAGVAGTTARLFAGAQRGAAFDRRSDRLFIGRSGRRDIGATTAPSRSRTFVGPRRPPRTSR